MPTLIVVRLRPTDPTTGAAFTAALAGLTITAYDLGYADTLTGVELGSASGVFSSGTVGDDAVDITTTGIVQHYADVGAPGPVVRVPTAAATAIIVANPPAGHPEYPGAGSFDLRLTLERGGTAIADNRIDTNVTVVEVAGALSNDQNAYLAMPPSAYAVIPAAGQGAAGALNLAPGDPPPSFAALVTAVDGVLAKDPADGATLAHRVQLTPAQAQQVAAELVWDRAVFPPPAEPRPLGEMYTDPPADPGVKPEDAENDRHRFEAELAGYYATHDAQVLRLGGFVYAASAAMLCERLSAGEDIAGAGPAGATLLGSRAALLTFPLITGAASGSTLTHAGVRLTGTPRLDPAFVVPAAYFYALAADQPPHVDTGQRYGMALADPETKVLTLLDNAVATGMVGTTELPVAAAVPAVAVGPAQVARRLGAFGAAAGSAAEVPLTAPVRPLIDGWLGYAGASGTIDADFWTAAVAASPGAYLTLVLHVVTDNFPPLIAAVTGPPLSVSTVAELAAVSDGQWRALFLPPGAPPRLDLLPPFTQVAPQSTPADQVDAFL
ncbi:MAG TPA: hypothetical protein VLM05_04020, partial [Mycobacteriales bacterium]|nr:hypothetical protein [Mycobacteriales bacterium]